MREDLINEDLFGNEAGEDEDKERLESYFFEKVDYSDFYSKKKKLRFVRSRKGVGKSAMLNYAEIKVKQLYPDDLIINIKANELLHLLNCEDYSPMAYENCWQQRICTRVLNEVANYIRFPLSGDELRVIESAEIMGFKGKNLFWSLLERIKIGIGIKDPVSGKEAEAGVEFNEGGKLANPYEVLKRFSENNSPNVWMLIDDIDATFINNANNMVIIGIFFTACRNLVNSIKGFNIRASVRTDIWSFLKKNDEALDKCEQYMVDLKWSTKDTGEILYRKIYSYFTGKNNGIDYGPMDYSDKDSRRKIFNLVFSKGFNWGSLLVDVHRPIHILSAGRPRWAAQLCKMAAKKVYQVKNSEIISIGDIRFVMSEYGSYRLSDLYKEHRHQCERIEEIIEIFRNGARTYPVDDLISLIDRSLISKGKQFFIDGEEIPSDKYQIASFLYRIGFITLRDDNFTKATNYTRFEEDPFVLTEDNKDKYLLWEIHPSYRNFLRIK